MGDLPRRKLTFYGPFIGDTLNMPSRYPSVVANKECIELLGPMPALYEECNQNATCPIWFTGPWKPVSIIESNFHI